VILTAVIPGGITVYVQAGEFEIYKSFKDKISRLTSEWKSSGTVELPTQKMKWCVLGSNILAEC